MAEYDELQAIGENIYRRIGFIPTSNSTKPAHIANGLLRCCCNGQYADITGLHDWIALSKSLKTSSVPAATLIAQYKNMFENYGEITEQQINDFRALLEAIFNVDGAAFAGSSSNKGFSVLNPISKLLINNRVAAENDIEWFLYRILKAQINGKESPIIAALSTVAGRDNDDLSHIIKPISIQYQKIKGVDESIITRVHELLDIDFSTIRLNLAELAIRRGFDQLYENLKATGQLQDKLSTLERIICYASFSVVFYLLSLNSVNYGAVVSPILLDSYNGFHSVSRASELCFSFGKRSVEAYFVAAIREYLSFEVPELGTTTTDMEAYIIGMKIRATRGRTIDGVRNNTLTFFRGYTNQGEEPLIALSRALQNTLFTTAYSATSPSDFCQSLGSKAGLVGPNANRAKKRYVASQTLLENLVLCLLNKDELIEHGLEVKEFEERLWERYGILMGFDSTQCFSRLMEARISQNSPGDLRGELSANAQSILSAYISMGLAKQYADGVSILRLGV